MTFPHIKYEESPFYVNTDLKEWHNHGYPRRAMVNSQGVGGTNACFILEEAPAIEKKHSKNGYYIFPFSAKSKKSITILNHLFSDYFETCNENLGDVFRYLLGDRLSGPGRPQPGYVVL